jgi:hypothetical protein
MENLKRIREIAEMFKDPEFSGAFASPNILALANLIGKLTSVAIEQEKALLAMEQDLYDHSHKPT